MALVARHVGLGLRILACALALWLLGDESRALGQGAAFNNAPGMPSGIMPKMDTSKPQAAPSSPVIPQERVLDIRIVGNRTITRDKVLGYMGTRIDRPYDQATFDKDIRKLAGKNWFVDVQPHREFVPGGVIITLEVVERPTLEYVKFLGNKKIKIHSLSKEVNLKKGDSLDPYAVEEGQRKLETLYQTKGFNDVKVTILEGNKTTDHGAVFLIQEGTTQKIWKVKFEGNHIASDGRLKTQIQSKPPILYFFKGQVDRKKIEEDVDRLLLYYRSLGYFKATVGREPELNENEDWMTLTFYINEGPRYKVGNIAFIGNKVYDESALTTNLKLKAGDFFDQSKMNADIGYVKDLYGSNGYVFCEAKEDLRFFLEPGTVDLVYQVNEGKQCLVGEINVHISGDNPHTKKMTALVRVAQRPGDVIDIRKVRASERRLKQSALFNNDPTKGDVPRIVLSAPDSEDSPIAGRKKKNAPRRASNDSVRGQSPDAPPYVYSPPPLPQPYQSPAWTQFPGTSPSRSLQPATNTATSVLRSQSPDPYGGYGAYGGRTVNPVSPGPQNYTVNQPPNGGSTQPPITGAPPAETIYPPNYAPPGGPYAPGQQPPLGGLMPGQPEGPGFLDERPQIPFDVYLSEAQTGRFMFGAGVNSNAGLVGSIVLDEQNFDIWRWPSSWEDFRTGRALRGGGQKFRIEAAPGTQVSRYMFNFVEPYLFDTPVSYGLSGYYFNRFYRDWTEQRLGGRTSLGYQFTPDLSGNVALRAEDVRLSNPRVLGVPPLDAALGHTQLYSVKTQLAHDTRDSTFLPTEGHYISADFEYAFGTFQFPRWTVDARQHTLLRERPDGSGRHVLSFYNTFGITGPDTPIYETFYAGGFSTLRGFQFRGASPQINTVQVGGDFMNISSIEYMFPITADDMFRVVTFVDFGTVEPTVHIDWRNFRVAPGIGFRIQVPALGPAPIALDFAVPVQYAPTDIRQVFSFFVGYSR